MVRQLHKFRRSFYHLLSYIEFYSVLCIPASYVFQRQYSLDIFMHWDSIHHISFYVAHIFNILSGLYTIWKELKQLQPQDQCFQQLKTSKLLIQISPPLDEFLTKVREQLIIFSSTERYHPFKTFNRNAVTLRYLRQNNYYFYTLLTFL